jgi:hypothetical protein
MNFLKPEKKFNIKLQSPSKSLWSTIKKAYFLNKNFKSFWEKLDKTNLPEEWKEIFLDIGIEKDFFCHFGYRIK